MSESPKTADLIDSLKIFMHEVKEKHFFKICAFLSGAVGLQPFYYYFWKVSYFPSGMADLVYYGIMPFFLSIFIVGYILISVVLPILGSNLKIKFAYSLPAIFVGTVLLLSTNNEMLSSLYNFMLRHAWGVVAVVSVFSAAAIISLLLVAVASFVAFILLVNTKDIKYLVLMVLIGINVGVFLLDSNTMYAFNIMQHAGFRRVDVCISLKGDEAFFPVGIHNSHAGCYGKMVSGNIVFYGFHRSFLEINGKKHFVTSIVQNRNFLFYSIHKNPA